MDSLAAATATIVYILYLVGLVVGITTIVGAVIAYVNRVETPEWIHSHYQFQIGTFWIGMLYGTISILTMLILVDWLLALFTVVWLIVQCAKGMK